MYKKFVTPGQTFDLIFRRSCSLDLLRFQLPLRLLVVLGRVDTVLDNRISNEWPHPKCVSNVAGANLVVVDDVEPRKNVDEQLRVPRVTRSHTLDVIGDLRGTVQGLSLLHFVDHFPHVHLNLPGVLGESVETFCSLVSYSIWVVGPERHTAGSLVENVKSTDETNGGCKAHHGGKAAATDMRRAHSLHNPEGNGRNGGSTSTDRIIRRTSISEYTSKMPRYMVSLVQREFGADRTGRSQSAIRERISHW